MGLYPGALPAAGAASASATLAAAGHTSLHNTGADETRAIATKIGTGASTPTSGKLLRGNGVGTSVWGQADLLTDVTGVLLVANGGTGTTSTTGTGSVVYGTSPTITTPTLTTPTIASFANATHDHSNAAGGGATLNSPTIVTPTIAQINNSVAPGVKLQRRTQTDNSDSISSATTAGVITQMGWGQVLGGGAATLSETVTFPTAFTTLLGITVSYLGVITGTANDITGLTTAHGASGLNISASSPTASNFSVDMGRTVGTFANTVRYGYSWIAWGI